MALWVGLGQVATVAQLTGLDAAGLISMILDAVRTAQRNRKDCQRLAKRAKMIGDLLQKLQELDMMQEPAISNSLQGLEDTLRRAYSLISSCQRSNTICNLFMARKQAEQFGEVHKSIKFYLQLFSMISHIDGTRRYMDLKRRVEEIPGEITRRLGQIFNNAHPPSSSIQGDDSQGKTDVMTSGPLPSQQRFSLTPNQYQLPTTRQNKSAPATNLQAAKQNLSSLPAPPHMAVRWSRPQHSPATPDDSSFEISPTSTDVEDEEDDYSIDDDRRMTLHTPVRLERCRAYGKGYRGHGLLRPDYDT